MSVVSTIDATTENKKTVSFHTLGCRLNISESETIAKKFQDRGYEITPFGENADISFINTCTVTDKADSTCRNLIRKAQKSSPEGKIVVAGCYAQMDPKAIQAIGGVDLILGTSEKYKVFDYLDQEQDQLIKIDKTTKFWGAGQSGLDEHTRAFLKIQDGCNYVCSFCIIPQARGRSRTVSIKDAISEAKKILEQGHKEIVLTGVNIGEYESSSGESFVQLLKELDKLEGLTRIRLSSVEPNTITNELISFIKSSPKFLDHFHIPLQSGSDLILENMRRKYNVKQYQETILKLKEAFPNASFGADIICGFPGETKENFQETYELISKLPLTHLHVFPYSKRKNTIAARIPEQIQFAVKKERVKILIELGKEKKLASAKKMIGQTNQVLFEKLKTNNNTNEKYNYGHTSNFHAIKIKSDKSLKNKILTVKITGIDQKDGILLAEV